jgi:hypothetical protein
MVKSVAYQPIVSTVLLALTEENILHNFDSEISRCNCFKFSFHAMHEEMEENACAE